MPGNNKSAVTSFPAVLGAVLRDMRKSANPKSLTQAEMAGSVGVTVSTWSRIENGDLAITIEQLLSASEKLGMKPSAILFTVEEKVESLRESGVETSLGRISAQDIFKDGNIPLLGGALFGLLGPIGWTVLGATHLVSLVNHKKNKSD